nr:uncharacterized protein LOC108407303 isoform X4 [Manis javanica]
MTPSLSRPSGSATLRGLASEQVVPPAPGRAPPTAAQTPGGAGRMGPGFDPAFWRGLRGCLCCAVRGMTASPPRFAAWRARVPGPLARSAPLLLLLLWTAAASQGHPRNGPRISAVWKGPFLRDLTNVLQRPVWDAHHQRSLQPSPTARPAGLRAAQPSADSLQQRDSEALQLVLLPVLG